MIGFVHAFFAFAFSNVMGVSVLWSVLGSLFPDVDFLLPLTHRGATHSLAFGVVCYALIRYWKGRRKGFAFFFGFLTHLFLDSLTSATSLFFPFPQAYGFGLEYAETGLGVVFLSSIVLANSGRVKGFFKGLGASRVKQFLAVFFTAWVAGLVVGGSCPLFETSMDYLLSNMDYYSERSVRVSGTVCSPITTRASGSGNEYQVFDLCSEDDSLVVWKRSGVERKDLNEGEHISVCGVFTLKYLGSSGPEVYKVKKVS